MPPLFAADPRPIAVFDSGVGGLTVLKALREALPFETFCYLGDTARLPYGTKSAEAIVHYCLRAARFLNATFAPKALVIACNTASSFALDALREAFPGLPILGVIDATIAAAAQKTQTQHILLMATESTIRGGVYPMKLQAFNPTARLFAVACPVLVTMAEEGWCSGAVVEGAVRRYLDSILTPSSHNGSAAFDTVILGCTHFPILLPSLRHVFGPNIALVDSAQPTARALLNLYSDELPSSPRMKGALTLSVTDSPERFATVAHHFLDERIDPEAIGLINL